MSAAIADITPQQLATLIVWIPMLPGDDETAAAASSQIFEGQPVAQFYDGASLAGRAIAASLGADSHVAWDMYLTYSGDASWAGGAITVPREYAHQLSSSWADQARYFTGVELRDEIARMVQPVV